MRIAEWTASMRSYFQLCRVPEEDQIEILKQLMLMLQMQCSLILRKFMVTRPPLVYG